MKKITYFLILTMIVMVSCNPMEDIYEELEEMDKGYEGTFTHELTSDDYEAIAEKALQDNPGDTLNADFIVGNEYFTDSVSAAEYIPLYIPELYPALGEGSNGMITYNYSGTLPENLTMYTEASQYEVMEEEYTSIDEVLDYSGYFSPSYAPGVYIPSILASAIDTAENGDIMLVEYLYSDVDPKIDTESSDDVAVFEEGFTEEANGLGQFTQTSVDGAQTWEWNQYDDGNAKMSGFDGSAVVNEDWLISSAIDLSGLSEATLSFRHAINYLNDQWDQLSVHISTDYDGSDIAGASWTELTVPNWGTGDSWSFVESGAIDLTSYIDQTVFVAFKYTSSADNAATWEIGELKVTTPGAAAIIGEEPMTYKTYHTYNEDAWERLENVYYINAVDYNAMGEPGNFDNFSGSERPEDYIPLLLNDKYPLAGEGTEVVVVYKYYAGTTLTLASTYTYEAGAWTSSWDYVEEKSAQFIYGGSGWVFDPTISFTMNADDYQIIVDYVNDEIGEEYVDTYGTFESYYGAGSYYVNFDIRESNFNSSVFETWEDAIASAIGDVLLPAKYPDTQTQVNGVDMYYLVSFETYSGASGNYTMRFQVTKAGPDPEFTLVEGPY